jgi:type II restriction enzyme
VDLRLPTTNLGHYKSPSQRARVCTEPWGAANLYCPACDSSRIEALKANTPAHDFKCPRCDEWFQLKSKSAAFGRRIQDGAFDSMRRSILKDQTPSLYLLQYKLPELMVENVLLIPRFALSLSVLEKRNPLSPNAQRAGWIGCNFLLDRIPADAQISVIQNRRQVPPSQVRRAYEKVRPLEKLNVQRRGWTLDVLNVLRSLDCKQFTLSDVYAHTDELARLHPKNAHVHDKIRQQLQVLRDLGLLEFLGGGSYQFC